MPDRFSASLPLQCASVQRPQARCCTASLTLRVKREALAIGGVEGELAASAGRGEAVGGGRGGHLGAAPEAAGPRVLGLDPGFASMGYALLELHPTGGADVVGLGVIRTKKSAAKRGVYAADDNLRRARGLAVSLAELVETHGVVAICAESMSFPRNASAAGKLSMAWGILAALTGADLPLVQASPQRIKEALCGRKDASKGDLEFELLKRYGNDIECLLDEVPASLHEHAYDALGAIAACLDSETIRLARTMAAQRSVNPARNAASGLFRGASDNQSGPQQGRGGV
jgi:Holliday junction resolvasome RuvABC endonuclease subunit